MCEKKRWWHAKCLCPSEPATDPGADESPAVEAAEAWNAVGLVNEWVRHAEAKAATTLAASGVLSGVLYNLVKDQVGIGWTLKIAAPASASLIIVAAVCATVALWPRLRSKDTPTSSLYFDHIARRHPHSSKAYIDELKALVANPSQLLEELGQQVWANARVARKKYFWAGWALVTLLGAALALAAVALKLALASIGVGDG